MTFNHRDGMELDESEVLTYEVWLEAIGKLKTMDLVMPVIQTDWGQWAQAYLGELASDDD